MKKALFAILTLATATLNAQTVEIDNAQKVARQYLSIHESPALAEDIMQRPVHQYYDDNGQAIIYVFNIGNYGFVITGADKSFSPIVGYSFNGAFDANRLPDNLELWLEGYVDDVAAIKKSSVKSADIIAAQHEFKKEWQALENGGTDFYDAKGSKAVNALVETRWDQGDGYNNYCPEYNGGHSVTGCVATAMAQIIRYHQYPNVGFYHKSYSHNVYGMLHADFDSAYYDYSLMPVSINYYSSSAQRHAVSLLCYHCGVSVSMNYQSSIHTSGSGAHSESVPSALKYFGYLNSFFLSKNANNSIWDSLLRHDLDAGLPVYYSGNDNDGGHAFVCDGYKNDGRYHFNFGWSGYGDGYYTLTSVNGYSSAQGAVFNIYPCQMGPMRDTLYIAQNGQGGGSSWNSAYPQLESALKICGLYKKGTLWVKNGTYYGDTTSEVAFTIPTGVTIYGGFAGTESSIDERNLQSANTILSGDNKRAVLYSPITTTNSKIYDITFANGLAETGSGAYISSELRIERCIFDNNHSTAEDGAAVYFNEGNIVCSILRNNYGGAAHIESGYIKNCLIVHNDGYGINAPNGIIDGCDIVCNTGVGVINQNNTKIRNCIFWHNDSSLTNNDITHITFSAIEGFGERDSNSNFGISHENRPTEGIGPFFVAPDLTLGPAAEMGDWRLSSLSPLVNAGDTNRSGSYNTDLAGGNRFRSGRLDIGCYEQDPYVGFETPDDTPSLRVYPNPAAETINIESTDNNICIYDIMGRCVLRTNSYGHTSLDISHLPNGIYLLRTENKTAKFLKK